MIAVTDRAASQLQELLENQGAPEGQGVKLIPDNNGGIGMVIAPPAEGDDVVQREGSPVLIVDRMISQALDGMELDAERPPDSGPEELQFTLRQREAKQ